MDRKICSICKCAIPTNEFDDHFNSCLNPNSFLLSDYQKCAIKYCKNRSKIISKQNQENIKNHWATFIFSKMYNDKTLESVKKFIKETPVIIHFNLDKMYKFFETDIKYKNCFEIHQGRGNSYRLAVEDYLFNKIYGSVSAENKVKYGCLNLYRSNYGVRSATGYGDSYIVLKESVKDRISFCFGDSFNKPEYISTFDYFDQILLSLPYSTMENILKIINHQSFVDDNYSYIEAQIHGDVVFSRDIELLMINARHKDSEIIKYIQHIPYKFIVEH